MAQSFLPPMSALIILTAWLGKSPDFVWILAVSFCSLTLSLPLLYGRSAGVPEIAIATLASFAIACRLLFAPFPGVGEILFLCGVAALAFLGFVAKRSQHLERFLAEAQLRRTGSKVNRQN